MQTPAKRKSAGALKLAFAGLLLALTARLFYKANLGSTDFSVYWKAVQTWVRTPVSFYYYDAETRGFVFKYPPWVLPLFSPLALMGFEISKFVWAGFELFCLGYSIRWVLRAGARPWIAWTIALMLWWIWQDHFWSGQLTIALLACALWAVPPEDRARAGEFPVHPTRTSLLGIVCTAKIFSVITLLGVWKRFLKPRVWGWSLGLSVGLTFLVLAVMWAHGIPETPVRLFQEWIKAAGSGGAELGAHVVRGQMNHGFTAGVLRWAGADPRNFRYDTITALILALVFSVLWFRYSRALNPLEAWAGWIAVGLISHPLAWDHSFVLAYPLCALSAERTLRSGQKSLIALSFFGASCIGILIPNVIGTEAVRPLELVSVKSWGVVFSAIALITAARRQTRQRARKPA